MKDKGACMKPSHDYYGNFSGNNRTCYTFYYNPRSGDTFKRRDPSATMGEPPTLFVPETKLNEREVSVQRPTKSKEEMALILKAKEISSKLFAPCPCEEHSFVYCFGSAKNICHFFSHQCIGEMGSLKQDTLRQRLNEIPTSEERWRYICNNFNSGSVFEVKEWFYDQESSKEFIPNIVLLEGGELEDEIAYKNGDADTREMLLFKTMEKLKKSEEFTYFANKKELESKEPLTKKRVFQKVKEELGKLFF